MRNLLIVLVIGLIHGLVYIWLIPPWQHYDEPNHFEYAWLISSRNALPAEGEFDYQMRVQVAESMVEHDFFRQLGFLPDLLNPNRPPWIGPVSQLSNPPLYYLIASLPMRFLDPSAVDDQLVGARLISLGFYLLSLLAAWGIAIEITPEKHPIRLYLPATIAMLPGFVDVMTAVNNDAAAVAFFSLFTWGCLRLIVKGLRILPLAFTLLLTILCSTTKETAYIALPLFFIALFLTIIRNRLRWTARVLVGVGAAVILFVALSSGDASNWYRSSAQSESTRAYSPQAVIGKNVFRIKSPEEITPAWSAPIFQPIPVDFPVASGDISYTVGAWIWADEPASVNAPILGNGRRVYSKRVGVGTTPTFVAYTAEFPVLNGSRLWIRLDPGVKNESNTVYYDGIILVDKFMDLSSVPDFADESGSTGFWGGIRFNNMVRNASAEVNGLRISSWLDDIGVRLLPDQTRPSALLTYFLDWKNVVWHYRLTSERLFRTFWGQFGWGHVPLLGNKPYRPLALITLLGVTGYFVWFLKRIIQNRKMHWDVVFFLGILMLAVWGAAISRGVLFLGHNRLYLPVARYAYPAIIPTMLVICIGWQELFSWLSRWNKLSGVAPTIQKVVWFGSLFLFDLYAIASIASYYRIAG